MHYLLACLMILGSQMHFSCAQSFLNPDRLRGLSICLVWPNSGVYGWPPKCIGRNPIRGPQRRCGALYVRLRFPPDGKCSRIGVTPWVAWL